MKTTFLILILLVFNSCNEFNEQKIRYGISNTENLEEIILDLEKVKSYTEVCNFVEKTICKNELPILKFKANGMTYEIVPVNMCEKIKWDPAERDIIKLKNNNWIEKSGNLYPMDSIEYLFNLDYFNPLQNPAFTLNPEKLIIIIEQHEDEDVKNLMYLFELIIETYNKLNILIDLKILLDLNEKPPAPRDGK